MRLVCLSDTHCCHGDLEVPDGDVLVHGGDFTWTGEPAEVRSFADFLAALPHRHKIVVAGNHDFLFQDEPDHALRLLGDVTYLRDSGVRIGKLLFWGSPWQPWFGGWAFNLHRGAEIARKWDLIPRSTDVLVTHGPPEGVLDRTSRGEVVGCLELKDAVERLRPRLHVFGHIHESYGTHLGDTTLSVNASNFRASSAELNPPVVLDWDGAEFQVALPGE